MIFLEKLSGFFLARSGSFFARRHAVALSAKPPLATRIAQSGLSTTLTKTYYDPKDDQFANTLTRF